MTPSPYWSRPRLGSTRSFRRATHWITCVCVAVLTQACKDTTSPITGTASGTVVLTDSWANRLADFSGVDVSIDGMSTGAVTDALGAWHIDGVPAGKRDITFSKATFGTYRLTGLQIGDSSTVTRDITLAITPWQQAIIDSVYVATRSTVDYYVVDGHLSDPPPSNAFVGATVAFFGGSIAVSPDPKSYQSWGSSVDIGGKASKFSIALRADGLRTTFGVGGKAYVGAYVTPAICDGCGARQANDPSVFSNTGPRANVVLVTIH